MSQKLELEQEKGIELSQVHPIYKANTELAAATSFSIQQIDIEINSPDNLTLQVTQKDKLGHFSSHEFDFKKFSEKFTHQNNKHTLDTKAIKDFQFDTSVAPLAYIKATSHKFSAFKIALQYSFTPKN